jgi:hypothetical protein
MITHELGITKKVEELKEYVSEEILQLKDFIGQKMNALPDRLRDKI